MYRECNLEFYLRVAFSRTHKKNQIRFHDQLLFYTDCRKLLVGWEESSTETVGVKMLGRISIGAQRWTLRRMELLAERTGRLRGRPAHLLVGERGEREAMFYLRQQGYVVVARRWKTGRLRGEVDVIALEEDVLCFVEVKTRATRNVMDPAEAAVDRDKQRMVRTMAEAYLRGFPEDERARVPVRFDVLAVYLEGTAAAGARGVEFELFRGAFRRRA